MEFTGTTQAELRTARISLRDAAAHEPSPPGESQVSPEALLEATRAARARVEGTSRGARAGADIDTAIAAATLPPIGRPQSSDRTAGTDDTARPGPHRTDRSRGDGPARGQ